MTVLTFRSGERNCAAVVAAPAAFLIVAERATGRGDVFEVLLRGEHAGRLPSAMQHARTVAASLGLRHRRARCRVTTADGRTLFVAWGEGGAA